MPEFGEKDRNYLFKSDTGLQQWWNVTIKSQSPFKTSTHTLCRLPLLNQASQGYRISGKEIEVRSSSRLLVPPSIYAQLTAVCSVTLFPRSLFYLFKGWAQIIRKSEKKWCSHFKDRKMKACKRDLPKDTKAETKNQISWFGGPLFFSLWHFYKTAF